MTIEELELRIELALIGRETINALTEELAAKLEELDA